MASYITIDSGTTNTRITLVCDGVITDTLKFGVDTLEPTARKAFLSKQIKIGIDDILERNKISPQKISRIIASGMITSEIGLIEIEHLNTPCGIYELARNLYETVIEEISEIPFVFIRGVKCVSKEHIDMMRGEETEIYGMVSTPNENSLYVLPGSHSKLIFIDKDNRISHFSTELTGEMINAIANNTILKGIIKLDQSAENAEYLQKGYLFCKENGMNAALFKVRSLKKFSDISDNEALSFFMGIMLTPEIENIIKSKARKIIIGGKNQLKNPTAVLLKLNSKKEIEKITEEAATNATVYGAVRIYEKSLNI